MGLNSYGSAIDEAYKKGANRKEANLYGLGSAAVETATEYLTSGIPGLSKVSNVGLDNLAEAGLRKIPNKIVREAAKIGYKAAGEGLEEGVTEIINPFLKNATYSKGEKIDWNQVKKAATMGAMTVLVLNGPADFYNMNQAIKEQVNTKRNNIKNNIQNVTTNEKLSTPVQSNTVLNNESNNISNQTNELNLKQSAQNYNIDVNNETINSIDKTLAQRSIKARFDSNSFINSNENAFWQLNEDGSREVVFNPNAKTNDLLENVAVNELYHDIASSKDGEKLRTELLDFAKTKEGYQEARTSLEKTYSNKYDPNSPEFTKLVDEEAVASILGKKLGNQEFVNSLTVEKPSVAKTVYNWVVDKLNKLNKMTGYKSEKLFWKDVKNKFDSAYRSDYLNGNTKSKFSIQTDSKGNQFVNIDTNQHLFDGKSLNEQNKIAKRYILDNFRKNGLTVDDSHINVTSKTANEYTHPRNQLPAGVKSAKMRSSTELNNLLKISKYQYSKKDDGRHVFAKDGWDYYETIFNVDGNLFKGLINIGKSGNKKTLYDITQIKRISQNRSTSANAFTTSLANSIENNIP